MYHPSLSIIIHYHPLSAIIVYHPFSSTNNYYTHDCSPIITTSLVNVYIANWKFPPSLTSVNQLNLPFSLFWHNQRENLQPKKHCCWVYHQLFRFFLMFFCDFDAFSHGFPMVFPWFSHGFAMVFLQGVGAGCRCCRPAIHRGSPVRRGEERPRHGRAGGRRTLFAAEPWGSTLW